MIAATLAGATLVAPAAQAALGTTNGFTVDGDPGNGVASRGALTFTNANAAFSVDPVVGGEFELSANPGDLVHAWHAMVGPPTGTVLTAGQTYPTASVASATSARLNIFGDGHGCNSEAGSMTVEDIAYSAGATVPDRFAISYSDACDTSPLPAYGVLRYHSSFDVTAVHADKTSDDWGEQSPPGSTSAAHMLRIDNPGTVPVAIGAATLSGPDASAWSVSSNGCSVQTLVVGASCLVGLAFVPGHVGSSTALLLVADGSRLGHRHVDLSGVSYTPVSAPQNLAVRAGATVADLTWQPPADLGGRAGVSTYFVYRGTSADTLTLLQTVSTLGYRDTGLAPATTYYYAVDSPGGDRTPPVSATTAVDSIVWTHLGSQSYAAQWRVAASGAGPTQVVASLSADASNGAISPDGTQIAFTAAGRQPGERSSLWIGGVGGVPDRSQITTGFYDDNPTFSASGASIVFTRRSQLGYGKNLYVIPASGGTATPVPGATNADTPAFSPGGRQLAYADLAVPGIVVQELNGGGRAIIAGTTGGRDPAWSPDGQHLAFVRSTSPTTSELLSVTPSGRFAVVLAAPPGNEVELPAWSADGGTVVFGTYHVTRSGDPHAGASLVRVAATGGATAPVFGADGSTNWRPISIGTRMPADTTPPAGATGIGGTVGPSRLELRWTNAANPDLSEIVVRRGAAGAPAPATPDTGTLVYAGRGSSATAAGLTSGAVYRFSVFTIDASANAARATWTSPVVPGGIFHDFSGDGHPDLISRSSDGLLHLYTSNGVGGFIGSRVIGSGWNGFSALFTPGDWNGDGHPDIIGRTTAGDLLLYLWNGTSFTGHTKIGVGWNGLTAVLSPGDFTGDGHPDIIGRTTTGELRLYLGNGVGISGSRVIGVGWNGFNALLTAGDWNGDGHPDLLGRTSTGDLLLYLWNGTSFAAHTKIGIGWNTLTALFSLGDFDDDGHPDIIARTSTGDLRLYQGNGTGLTGSRRIGIGWNGMNAFL
ncbi:MAG: FG-GAP-like repeat-containing protein [Actinomycetota bacterium]|nr:FG-GAP-like repeat-containing protein [Actinomycetota bacterium]